MCSITQTFVGHCVREAINRPHGHIPIRSSCLCLYVYVCMQYAICVAEHFIELRPLHAHGCARMGVYVCVCICRRAFPFFIAFTSICLLLKSRQLNVKLS